MAKAITAAYLSTSHGNAFTTRTASQIVQDHFNPGTEGAPSGPLFGVQFSSLPCSDMMVDLNALGTSAPTQGPHRSPLGLAGDPGGFPLYKNGVVVGGIGVKAEGPYRVDEDIYDNDHSTDEIEALAGTHGYGAPAGIVATTITAGGLILRYSDANAGDLLKNPASAAPFSKLPASAGALLPMPGYFEPLVAGHPLALRTGSRYGTTRSGIVQDTTNTINGTKRPYLLVDATSHVRYPAIAGTGTPNGLTRAEALQLLRAAYASGIITRAQIRNPPGSPMAVTVSVVDANGTILAVATIPDAPVFGIDVSLQKARSAVFMSSAYGDLALKIGAGQYLAGARRAAGVGYRPLLQGIDRVLWPARLLRRLCLGRTRDRQYRPRHLSRRDRHDTQRPAVAVQAADDAVLRRPAAQSGAEQHHPAYRLRGWGSRSSWGARPSRCPTLRVITARSLPAPPTSPTGFPVLSNGLQIFPGGFPVYRGNKLVGGVGISGDGVDQDDMTGFLGVYNAGQQIKTGIGEAPFNIRASVLNAHGAAPHYVNCPYSPYVGSNSQNLCIGK